MKSNWIVPQWAFIIFDVLSDLDMNKSTFEKNSNRSVLVPDTMNRGKYTVDTDF